MNNNYTNTKHDNKNKNKTVRINYNIHNAYSRVIEENKAPTIMKTVDAIKYAESLGLDLVEIGYDKANNCSNCKIIDYSKYIYDLKKKEKLAKKQARASMQELKSLQMSLTIDIADKERLISHAKEFLEAGDKVRIVIRFRNRRESENLDLAKNLMKEVLASFDGIAVLDSKPALSGKELACIIRHN